MEILFTVCIFIFANFFDIFSGTGYLKFLFLNGRSDDIVITGGENISLSKIKTILFKHHDISDVYLDTEYDDQIGTIISAFVEVLNNNLNVHLTCCNWLNAFKPNNFELGSISISAKNCLASLDKSVL